MTASGPRSELGEALEAALYRCEAACRALGDACSAGSDVVMATRTPALAACAGHLMDCWYMAGATARLISRHPEHSPKTIAMMVAVVKQVALAATSTNLTDAPREIRAWVLAARECARSAAMVLSLLWERAMATPPTWADVAPIDPILSVTQELDSLPGEDEGDQRSDDVTETRGA